MTLHHNLVKDGAVKKFHWPDWLPTTPHSVSDILDKYEQNLTNLKGKVDMIVGGPPCQGFSSAGRRDPLDPRNKLVESYLRIVALVQPKVVLIENVKGITQDFEDSESVDGKRNYANWILERLSEDYLVSSKTLDTSQYGVPQRRQRFFIVAVRKNLNASVLREPFVDLENDRSLFLKRKGGIQVPVSSRSAISDLEIGRNGVMPSRDTPGFNDICYTGPMTSYQRLLHGQLNNTVRDTRLARHKPHIVTRFREIIRTCHANGRLNVSLSSEFKASLGLKKCAIRVLDPENLSPTITSMPDDLLHYSEPRTLTVRENARLQSFPDWFEFQGKYTSGGDRRKREVPRFTQVANAVPPLMAEAIGIMIAKHLAKVDADKSSTSS
jgi:DNA (cytosine-5)-methyltransferase 1